MRAHHVGAIAVWSWFAPDIGTAHTHDGYVLVSMNGDAVETYYFMEDMVKGTPCHNIDCTARVFKDSRVDITAGEGHTITLTLCDANCCRLSNRERPIDIRLFVWWCTGRWYSLIGGFIVIWGE